MINENSDSSDKSLNQLIALSPVICLAVLVSDSAFCSKGIPKCQCSEGLFGKSLDSYWIEYALLSED